MYLQFFAKCIYNHISFLFFPSELVDLAHASMQCRDYLSLSCFWSHNQQLSPSIEMPLPPSDAYSPGTKLVVGSHRISITKYISAGGFATVYTCETEPAFHGNSTACLKRVIVPNKIQLSLLRQEVDAMKRLRGNKHIVSYIDSHASRLPLAHPNDLQQYEVLLLMEYCSNNGLIDFLNTRLTHRLTEREVLSIMAQITTGVAMCHHLLPPLLHRDIKIENVLIDAAGTYKLCDFGSAVPYAPVPTNAQELHDLHSDIMHHTTPQYRSPEMIDLTRSFPIDDKLDIWALGCFLYKLCYYTTPFELPHQTSLKDLETLILNCNVTLRFPGSPQYSSRLQNVIRCCLREDPRRRPNALQLLQEVCLMQGISELPQTTPYSVRISKTATLAHDTISSASANGKPPFPRSSTTSSTSAINNIDAPPMHPLIGARQSKTDVFASIDKSKILSMGSEKQKAPIVSKKTQVALDSEKTRPDLLRSLYSSASLKSLIQQQVHDSTNELGNIRSSGELDRGTLDFLKSKEDDVVGLRQNTGGSFKASLKKGLRRISTGGSVSSQRTGSISRNQRTGSGSGKPNVPNGKEKSNSPEEERPRRLPSQEGKLSSIKKRMSLLLQNSEKQPPKTASGYGKYTDLDDISAINYTNLSKSASAESIASPELASSNDSPAPSIYLKPVSDEKRKSLVRLDSKLRSISPEKKKNKSHSPPPCPPELNKKPNEINIPKRSSKVPQSAREPAPPTKPSKPRKVPPPKPKKPVHLKKPELHNRLSSISSEFSIPDVDDLERQFAKRFPSHV